MAPQPDSLALEQRIHQELSGVEARAAELRIALKVLEEFAHEVDEDVEVEVEMPTEGTEKRRIILTPSEDVPRAVKSRLAERSAGSELADQSFELEKN